MRSEGPPVGETPTPVTKPQPNNMKHQGKTPAIFANKRRALIIQPGQTIPRGMRFIISHANLTVLAYAFDKSTNGQLDGRREPYLGGLRSYDENAEAVLQRVVDAKIEPVTLDEFQVLRHALGSFHLSPTQLDLGWRNYCNLDYLEGRHGEAVEALVKRGLMDNYAKNYYRATERGAILAGVHPDEAGFIARGGR
jgi:hypothetical protein